MSFIEAASRDLVPIRITAATDGMATTIRVEGRLARAAVAELRAACESANPPIRLDLSGLRSAVSDGFRVLRSLWEAGAELHGADAYISQILLKARKKA